MIDPTPAAPGWRDLLTYQKETHPSFHTIPDYRSALRLLASPYPRVTDILKDWTKN
jgi:hypothetical protein